MNAFDRTLVLACALVGTCAASVSAQISPDPERVEMFERYFAYPYRIVGGSIRPHWIADGSRFWYVDETSGKRIIYEVDPTVNTVVEINEPRGVSESSRLSGEVGSPDGRFFASVSDHNVWIRAAAEDQGAQVTSEGVVDYDWVVAPDTWSKGFWTGTGAKWSRDGRKLALKKVDGRLVEHLPFIRFTEEPGAPLGWTRFVRPGDPTFEPELFVLDVASRKLTRLDTGDKREQRLEFLVWRESTGEILFLRLNRRHDRLDLLSADPATGESRVILTERRETFVVGAGHGFEHDLLTIMPDGDRFVWKSDRDGWDHYYLYDFDGTMINRITRGRFPVIEVAAIDDRWLYFEARSEEQPYDGYLYRARLDGSQLTRLTDAPGNHKIAFSPSKEYFLDAHSSLSRPPRVDLRRADGELIRTITEGKIPSDEQLPWVPEEFVVKALDGETDLYGVLYKPYDFDPKKKYPVVEYIYNGPLMSLRASRSPYTSQLFLRAVAQLGFIVFIADGPGTPERGRKFLEAHYMRVGQYEIDEHVNILKQLVQRFPYMDDGRVGIVGHSTGGYLALRAMLTAADVYDVGVAVSITVDCSYENEFYYEPYLGFPQDNPEAYEAASNLPLASNLRGKLLMIAGTEDYGAYPGTLKMAEEFIRHGKQHDLIVLPGQEHEFEGESSEYAWNEVLRYLVTHLEP